VIVRRRGESDVQAGEPAEVEAALPLRGGAVEPQAGEPGEECLQDDRAFQRINAKEFQAATVPEPLSEQGWQIIDEFNRAFAGRPATRYVAPVHITTAANSAGAQFWDSEGYRDAYRKIWGK
jgi:hypothetical protein